MPQPKAKPCHSSGSRPAAAITALCARAQGRACRVICFGGEDEVLDMEMPVSPDGVERLGVERQTLEVKAAARNPAAPAMKHGDGHSAHKH